MLSNTELISMLADKAGGVDFIWHYLAAFKPVYISSEGNSHFGSGCILDVNFYVVKMNEIFIGFKVLTSERYSHNEYEREVTSLIMDSICECEARVMSHTIYKKKTVAESNAQPPPLCCLCGNPPDVVDCA